MVLDRSLLVHILRLFKLNTVNKMEINIIFSII